MGIQLGYDVIDGFVYVELFAAKNVDERGVPVGECVYADVAFSDYDESADSPFCRIFGWTVDERVGRRDLVHSYHVGKFV